MNKVILIPMLLMVFTNAQAVVTDEKAGSCHSETTVMARSSDVSIGSVTVLSDGPPGRYVYLQIGDGGQKIRGLASTLYQRFGGSASSTILCRQVRSCKNGVPAPICQARFDRTTNQLAPITAEAKALVHDMNPGIAYLANTSSLQIRNSAAESLYSALSGEKDAGHGPYGGGTFKESKDVKCARMYHLAEGHPTSTDVTCEMHTQSFEPQPQLIKSNTNTNNSATAQ